MRHSGLFFRALALLLALSCGPASAERPIIRAGLTAFPPYSFVDPDGRASGLSVDILAEGAARLGYDIEFVSFDNPGNLVEALSDGRVDVTGLLAISDDRARRGTFTRPVGSFTVDLSFADPPPPGAVLGAIDGLRITTSPGSFPDRLLAERPGVTLVYHDTFAERLVALLSGNVDAVAGPARSLEIVASAAGLTRLLSGERFELAASPNALLVDAGQPALVAAFDAYILEAQADGTIAQFEDLWLSPPSLTLQEWAANHLGAVLATFAGVVVVLGGGFVGEVMLNRIRSREAARIQTIIDAFDLARAGIAIYDANLRAEISNTAFDEAFPAVVAGIRRQADLPDLFRQAHISGYLEKTPDAPELDDLVGSYLRKIETGEGFETSVRSADGRVLLLRGLRLAGARVAIVTTDVTELEKNRRALAERAGELKAANARLEAFTRVAAHDLKSPAVSAATLLDWLADDLSSAEPDLRGGFVEIVEKARVLLRRQVVLIDDLLAYARTSNKENSAVHIRPEDRFAFVLDLIEIPEGFTVEIAEGLPPVVADLAAFDLVLRNLVSNAIKHHDRSEGHIAVTARPCGPLVVFEVADDGPGIAPEFAERVFEPFFKLRSHDEVKGSGLGLSMIKTAVQVWGGTIALRPAPRGRGTIVQFTVPAAKKESVSAPAATAGSDGQANREVA